MKSGTDNREKEHFKVRKAAELKLLYEGRQQKICESPEWAFLKALCNGRIEDAGSFFGETKQFEEAASIVDVPYGRFEGKDEIQGMAQRWLLEYSAESAFTEAYFQTRAGGRSVTEVVVSFVVNGMINEVPMFVVGDLRAHGMLDEVRIYHHCTFLPQYQPYRKPMFRSAHMEMGDPGLLTGAVREYYEALRRIYGQMATYIPRWVGMRYETIIDDGVTGVIEWFIIRENIDLWIGMWGTQVSGALQNQMACGRTKSENLLSLTTKEKRKP